MKSVKVEGSDRRDKEVVRMTGKEFAQINQLLSESTRIVSDWKTAHGGMRLRCFLHLFIISMAFGLVTGVFLSQRAISVHAAPPAQTVEAGDVEYDDANEANEADETGVQQDQTGITAEEASAAAEAANPGTKALEVELEKENGVLVYEVELDNGLEVMVDPANGDILGIEEDETD